MLEHRQLRRPAKAKVKAKAKAKARAAAAEDGALALVISDDDEEPPTVAADDQRLASVELLARQCQAALQVHQDLLCVWRSAEASVLGLASSATEQV